MATDKKAYIVTIERYAEVLVIAESEDEAKDCANDGVDDNEFDGDTTARELSKPSYPHLWDKKCNPYTYADEEHTVEEWFDIIFSSDGAPKDRNTLDLFEEDNP